MRHFYFWMAFMLITTKVFSQNTDHRSIQVDRQLYPNISDSIKSYYDQNLSLKHAYINGKIFRAYFNPMRSSPFLNEGFANSTIYSNGKRFDQVSVAYDTYKDEFILMPIGTAIYTQIILNADLLDSIAMNFQKERILLKKIKFDENNLSIKDGFYENSDFNKFSLYIRYYAELTYEEARDIYIPKKDLFIRKDANFYPINKKKQLVQLFPDDKKLVKKKINSMNTPYRKFNQTQFVKVLTYIDSL